MLIQLYALGRYVMIGQHDIQGSIGKVRKITNCGIWIEFTMEFMTSYFFSWEETSYFLVFDKL